MDILQNTFYINLEHRTDRLEHVKNELKKIGVEGERFNAIKTKSGAIGCTLSHIKCLEIAKERKYEEVFICEDDITFTNPTLFLENLKKFCDNEDIMWDVLIIGGNNVPPYKQYYEYCARVFNCQTTTGYIVKEEFYDVMIDNFKEGLNKLIKNTKNTREFAIDIYWKKLQMENFWYMITPPTVTQYENFSDIEERQTNYNHLLLDMNKEWLFSDKRHMQFTE
tara:strand:+ start:8703 stop:9371 length:669 start_codon:yes stop_codon:yes gene_type:complete